MTTRTHRVIINFVDYENKNPIYAPVVMCSYVRRNIKTVRDYLLTYNSRTSNRGWGIKAYFEQLSKSLNYEEDE